MSAETTVSAIYINGVLRPKRRLPFRNHERLTLRIVRKPDPVEGTRGVIKVSRRFAHAVTTPHRFSILGR